jgi:hypothetical protein
VLAAIGFFVGSIILPSLIMGWSYGVFMLKLWGATLPFALLGAVVSLALPVLPMGPVMTMVGIATLLSLVFIFFVNDETMLSYYQEMTVRAVKVFLFLFVVMTSAFFVNLPETDMMFVKILALPMYLLAGKIFFKLKYG